MITRYSVWIDNKGLQDIDPSIYITDIKEKEPKQSAVTASQAWGNGLRLLRMQRQSLSVVVRFAIRERDTARRRDICTRIRAWAQEGYLTTSDRPGQRLYVVCEKIPTVTSALKWTDEMEMTFTAYDVPWWEDAQANTATASSSLESEHNWHRAVCYVCNRGTADAPVTVQVTAQGAIDKLLVYRDERNKMAFDDLGMRAGDVFSISYDNRGIVSIKVNDRSVLDKRRGVSGDNFFCEPGRHSFVVQWGEAPFTVRAAVRGRYV